MKVNDKRIIITGAGGGLGKELTIQLLAKGAYVAALDINEANLKTLKDVTNNSDHLSIHVVDITNDESLANFKADYYKTHTVVDGLINNAGIIQPFDNVDKLEMNTINRVMNVNFYGTVKLTKLFLPDLEKRPIGHIINISSMGGFFPFPGQTIYGASKAALKLFTEGLYSELLDSNVKVMLVLPGAMATDIAKNSNIDMKISASDSKIKMLSPVKAATIIIKGIEKDKFKLYVGSDSKLMCFMYKINEKFAIRLVNNMMKKAMPK